MSATLEELLKMKPAEIQPHNDRPTADQLRNKTQTYYDDVNVADDLPTSIYATTPTPLFPGIAPLWNRTNAGVAGDQQVGADQPGVVDALLGEAVAFAAPIRDIGGNPAAH